MFRDLYKKSMNATDLQESRRKALLIEQKNKRTALLDKQRDVHTCENGLPLLPDATRHGRTRESKKNNLDVSLQLSEWLRHPPENLTDWFLVVCPRGKRCLVEASHGYTAMYSKTGRKCFKFRSLLPGGGFNRSHISTTLDCIFVEKQRCFYILDAISLGSQNLLNCDAEFRFFWLRSKLVECEGLEEHGHNNNYSFRLLPHYDFEDKDSVLEAVQRYPFWMDNEPEVDGLLFYHKEASYTCGTTPLVCWLYPFMLEEMIGLKANVAYEQPEGYHGALEYMEQFDAKEMLKKKKKWQQQKTDKIENMEAEEACISEDGKKRKWEEVEEEEGLENVLNATKKLEELEDIQEIEAEVG